MTLSTEILVHVSAPSRGPDDARYRKEARELLAFKPVQRLELFPQQWQDGNACSEPEYSLKESSVKADDKIYVQRPVVPPQELPSSLIERLEKAMPYRAIQSCVEGDTSVMPLLHLPNTSKINAAVPSSAATPTPRLHVERTPALSRRPTTPTAVAFPNTASSPCHTKSGSWRTPPSVIPDSQPTGSRIGRPETSSSPYRKRAISSSPLSPSKQNNEHQKRKRRRGQLKLGGTSAARKGTDSDKPAVLLFSGENARGTLHLHSIERLPFEIHPPRPHPSTAQFSTHLTPPLRFFSRTLPLADLFKPSSQVRSPETLERGHWYMRCDRWDDVRKAKFWQFLIIFISEGRAGWGVWCSKEFESNVYNTGSSKENQDPIAMNEIVKVYCWGEVVREIWLLLWLASAKRIIGTGSRWVDAQGETIFQMH